MNKALTEKELQDFSAVLPMPKAVSPVTMSRSEKLFRWAKLVRDAGDHLRLYNKLEHWKEGQINACEISPNDQTAFGRAVADPTFQAAGLPAKTNLRKVMDFFEVSQGDLHEFSCDCGGGISNTDMASRIEKLAKPSMLARAKKHFGG